MDKRTSVIVGLLIVVIVGAALAVGLSGGNPHGSACKSSGSPVAYKVVIQNNKPSNDHITGKLCDTLTITNDDPVSREIAFGPHEHHVAYDGILEEVLDKGQSLTVTFNQTGNFHWHDHIHDEVQGNFTVTK